MGVPRLLQKALCELDLRLPSLSYVFPVDRFIGGGILYSQLYEYNVRDFKERIVEKLSGHQVCRENLYRDDSVAVISTARYLSDYRMELFSFQNSEGEEKKQILVLYYLLQDLIGHNQRKKKLIAFSTPFNNRNEISVYGTKQNYQDEIMDYYRIMDDDVNHAFSSIILNRKINYSDDRYEEIVPLPSTGPLKTIVKVKIMAKQSNNNL